MGTLVNATRFPILKTLGKSFKELKISKIMNIKWETLDDKDVWNTWVSDVLASDKDMYAKNIMFFNDDVHEFVDAHNAADDHREILKFKIGEVETAGVLVMNDDFYLRYSLQIMDQVRESDDYYMSIIVTFFKKELPYMVGVRRFFVCEDDEKGFISFDNVTSYSSVTGDKFLDFLEASDSGYDGNELLDAHNRKELVGYSNTIIAVYMSLREHRADCVTVPNKTKSANNGTPYDNFSGTDFTYIKNIREREEDEEFDYGEEVEESWDSPDNPETPNNQEIQEFGRVNRDPKSMFKVFVPVDKVVGPNLKEINGDNPLGMVFTEMTPKMGFYQKFKERYPAASYMGVTTIPVRWQNEIHFSNVYAISNNGVTVFLSNDKKALELFE